MEAQHTMRRLEVLGSVGVPVVLVDAMAIVRTVLPIMAIAMVVGTMVMVICMAVNVAATAVHPEEHIEIKLRE